MPREAASSSGSSLPSSIVHSLCPLNMLPIRSPSLREQEYLSRELGMNDRTFGHWIIQRRFPLPLGAEQALAPRGLHIIHLPVILGLTLLPPPCCWDQMPSGSWMQVTCTVGITSYSNLAGSASHLEDLEINTHSHYRHPWHFQELKVNGKELIVLNPHLDVRFRKYPSWGY